MNYLLLFYLKILSRLPRLVLKFKIWIFIHLLNYRKKVITNNLINSFPNKSLTEIKEIKNQFYEHLSELITEIIQLFYISKNNITKKVKFQNPELINSYYKKNKDIILVLGHYGNWEWALLAAHVFKKYEMIGIYKPLSSKFWDKQIKKIRSQFGATLISMKESIRYILKRDNKKPRIIGIITDQTPSKYNVYYSMNFLNQKTSVFLGAEKLAKKLNCSIIFAHIDKTKQGKYIVDFELITDDPKKYKEGLITQLYTEKLENKIRTKPELWLWSHRRWKHNQK